MITHVIQMIEEILAWICCGRQLSLLFWDI